MHYSDWLKIFNYFAQDNYCFIQTFIRSALKETLNSYFCLTQKIRGFTSLHNFPWNIKKKKIIQRHISLAGTDHWNSSLSTNISVWEQQVLSFFNISENLEEYQHKKTNYR